MSGPLIPKSILVKPGAKKPKKPNPVQFSEYLTLINGTVGTQVPFPDDKHGKKEKKVLRKEGLEPDTSNEGKPKKAKQEQVGNIDIEKIIGKSIYDSDSEDEKPAKNNKSKDTNSAPSISQILLTASDDENKKKKKKKKIKKNLKIGNEAATLIIENVYEILLLKSKFSQNCKFQLYSNGIIDCYENNEGESGTYNKYVMSFLSKGLSDNSVAEEFSNKTPNLISYWVCLECIPSIKSDGEEEPTLDEKFSMLIIFKDATERSQFNSAVEKFFKSKKSKIKNFRNSSAKNIKSLFGTSGKKTVDPFPGVNFHREEDEEPEDEGGKSKKHKKSKKKSKKDHKNNEKNESEEEIFNTPIKSTVTVDDE